MRLCLAERLSAVKGAQGSGLGILRYDQKRGSSLSKMVKARRALRDPAPSTFGLPWKSGFPAWYR